VIHIAFNNTALDQQST